MYNCKAMHGVCPFLSKMTKYSFRTVLGFLFYMRKDLDILHCYNLGGLKNGMEFDVFCK